MEVKFEIGKEYGSNDHRKFKYIADTCATLPSGVSEMICEELVAKYNPFNESGVIHKFRKNGQHESGKFHLISEWKDIMKVFAYMTFEKVDRRVIGRVEWTLTEKEANEFCRVSDFDKEVNRNNMEVFERLSIFGKKKKSKKKIAPYDLDDDDEDDE